MLEERVSKNLISILDPKAPATEAYRALRTNLHYSSVDTEVKAIVITSAGPAEGKSTTAANLAICMAQEGKKVLLIDADLRKPKLHKYFLMPNNYGITENIIEEMPLFETLKEVDEIPNLFLLFSGVIPPNPSEILSSKKMKELIEKLREKFDMLIIDAPPVAQLTDAAIIGTYVDGVVLVIAAGETNIEMAKKAAKSLQNVGAKILGSVLTKIDKKNSGGYYDYKYYSYYYGNQE